MKSTVKFVFSTTVLLSWLTHTALGANVVNESSTCFCLKSLQRGLRNPVTMVALRNGSHLLAEQLGTVWMTTPGQASLRCKVLDMQDRVLWTPEFADERGLLGIVPHPGYPDPQKIYVFYTREDSGQLFSYVSEVVLGRGPSHFTERVLLRIEQPHHRGNGGQLLFGKDGMLYVFVGHGGNSGDVNAFAQNSLNFLGKVLRLDVSKQGFLDGRPLAYDVPPDNPWMGNRSWLPEIFALGFRNPWRCSQDSLADASGHHRIFCGDTGESSFEEVNIVEKGRNYGWNLKEGLTCFNTTQCDGIENEGVPIYTYTHTGLGNAVAGGHVYRGKLFPSLYGGYVFGDVMTSEVFVLRETGGQWQPHRVTLCPAQSCGCDSRTEPGKFLLSFGQDAQGELYVLTTAVLQADQDAGMQLAVVPPQGGPATCDAQSLAVSHSLLLLACFLTLVFCRPSSADPLECHEYA